MGLGQKTLGKSTKYKNYMIKEIKKISMFRTKMVENH